MIVCELLLQSMELKHKPVVIWLFTGCFLVATMVVVGGITRLTHSGLSMVEWKLIMGMIPPLNETEWQETFDKYKQFPEYKLKHFHFTIEEFKSIFFWEYLHRLLGRVIGIVFIIPFFIFWFQKRFSKPLLKNLLIILFLGAFQGFLGWFMVKSGLSKDPNVSHYRLASHLISAFALFCYVFWVALSLIHQKKQKKINQLDSIGKLGIPLLVITILQIVYGAFVAGLKAGLVYNTWPKMGNSWIAESIPYMLHKNGLISLANNMASVQFIHRILALIVFFFVFFIFAKARVLDLNKFQKKSITFLVSMVTIQFILGVFTLIFAVPVSLGVLHQIGALALLGGIIYFIFHFRKSYSI